MSFSLKKSTARRAPVHASAACASLSATGFSAFVLSLPVATYCLYGIGFAPVPFTTRTMVHSVAGCAFYGAFCAKVLFVHTRRLPGWALPLVGATLLTAIVVAWLTSALWFFRLSGLHT